MNKLEKGIIILGEEAWHVDASQVEKLTQKLHETRLIHSCMTCVHFNHPDNAPVFTPAIPEEFCQLYNMRPPAKVIAYGCPSWSDQELPF